MSDKKHRRNDFTQRDEEGRQKAWGERRRYAERRQTAAHEIETDDFDEDLLPVARVMKADNDPLVS